MQAKMETAQEIETIPGPHDETVRCVLMSLYCLGVGFEVHTSPQGLEGRISKFCLLIMHNERASFDRMNGAHYVKIRKSLRSIQRSVRLRIVLQPRGLPFSLSACLNAYASIYVFFACLAQWALRVTLRPQIYVSKAQQSCVPATALRA